jgi:hypothetical protein
VTKLLAPDEIRRFDGRSLEEEILTFCTASSWDETLYVWSLHEPVRIFWPLPA